MNVGLIGFFDEFKLVEQL